MAGGIEIELSAACMLQVIRIVYSRRRAQYTVVYKGWICRT